MAEANTVLGVAFSPPAPRVREGGPCEHESDGRRCTGIQIGADAKCFAHTDDEAAQERALAELHGGGDLNFARGVPFTQELLAQILEHAPVEDGQRVLTNADFDQATFHDPRFDDVTFRGATGFGRATFGGAAWFGGATFSGPVNFSYTTFSGDAGFGGATFSAGAWFNEATFSAGAWFGGAMFSGDVSFDWAGFFGDANFDRRTFARGAWFRQATFLRDASFVGATFEQARTFGPIFVLGDVVFDDALFSENMDIEVSSNGLSLKRSRFRDGANLRVRWAVVTLDEADFSRPCLLAWLADPKHPLEIMLPALVFVPPSEPPPESRPTIVSLQRANVANLAVSAADLSACRFAGAHNLDQLGFEGKRQFAQRPTGWHRQLGWPPVWKWTVRRALAEEHEWRYRRELGIRKNGWYPQACQPPPPEDIHPLAPADIQNIYRDLRKGREDSKDEPGAADFYYGEMEMRRAATALSFEKLLLWLYWLVSGYGLRASRALFALVVTVLLCSVALNAWGVPKGDEREFAEIVVFSMQSTTSFLRAPDATLTLPGQVIQIALRLLGPLFFGLALLSLRGRVKR